MLGQWNVLHWIRQQTEQQWALQCSSWHPFYVFFYCFYGLCLLHLSFSLQLSLVSKSRQLWIYVEQAASLFLGLIIILDLSCSLFQSEICCSIATTVAWWNISVQRIIEQNNRTTESLRLENTPKIIGSNHKPNITMPMFSVDSWTQWS